MLNAPDTSTLKGLRDRALLAVALGCDLRRSEIVNLTFPHLQLREERWVIIDILGKHQRLRSVPMPRWCKLAIDAWQGAAGLGTMGYIFRPLRKSGVVVAPLRVGQGRKMARDSAILVNHSEKEASEGCSNALGGGGLGRPFRIASIETGSVALCLLKRAAQRKLAEGENPQADGEQAH